MILLLKVLMPFIAAALACQAWVESDVIIGTTAIGILRSWWCDFLSHDRVKAGKVLGRIFRWAIFGGVIQHFLNARAPEDIAAGVLVLVFLFLWRQGKLSGVWVSVKSYFQSKAHESEDSQMLAIEAPARPDIRLESYRTLAENEFAAFSAQVETLGKDCTALLERLQQIGVR